MTICTCNDSRHIVRRVVANKRPLSNIDKVRRIDPSHTISLSNDFAKALRRRIVSIKRKITDAIVTKDVFALSEKKRGLKQNLFQGNDYAFKTDEEKLILFMTWLSEIEKQNILGEIVRARVILGGYSRWTDKYIKTAYQKGISRARQELIKIGIQPQTSSFFQDQITWSFNRPIHLSQVGVLYENVFSELEGIVDAMDQQISRILSEGLMSGESPRTIARKINERVDKIGIERANLLSIMGITKAYHLANISEYQMEGIDGVKIKAEWDTSGFNVCPICQDLDGKIFDLQKIKFMLPKHPRCRCVAIPYLVGSKELMETVKQKNIIKRAN